MVSKTTDYWRKSAWDFLFLFAVPIISALLPWRLGWRWLRHWARSESGSLHEASTAALSVAKQTLSIADDREFGEKLRLLWLIDCRDLYVSLLLPRRWRLPQYIQMSGQWPQSEGFVAIGFHYGAGHFALRSLARAGCDFTFVSGRWSREDYAAHPVRYWYGKVRSFDIARLGRRSIAYRPGVKQQLNQTLQDRSIVLGMVDLPPRLAPRERRTATLLGHDLSLPVGLISLAREAGALVVPYWVEFDADMYRRRLCIGDPMPADESDASGNLAHRLDQLIRSAPYAWWLWPEFPGWTAADGAPRNGDPAD